MLLYQERRRIKSRLAKLALIATTALIIVATLSGCAATQAFMGTDQLNLSAIKAGADRTTVETVLQAGNVVVDEVQILPDDECIKVYYSFENGNEAAPGRAIAYLALDYFTLGIAEAPLMIYETNRAPDVASIVVTYDPMDLVIAANPAPKPSMWE